MHTPQLIIFGGTIEQVNLLTGFCPEAYEVRPLPFNFKFTASARDLFPSLIILLPDEADKKGLARLRTLRRKFAEVPLLVIAGEPTQEQIIEAFRAGATDFLAFPFAQEAFQRMLGRLVHGQAAPPARRTPVLRRLMQFMNRWLHPRRESAPFPSRELGFLPRSSLPLFKNLERDLHSADLSIRFFGSLEISSRGKSLKKLRGRKISSLLAYMLYHHGKPVHRETLMNEFWGENTPASARNSLNVAIHNLRKYFQEALPDQEVLLSKNECYCINPGLDLVTDVHQFLDYWQKGRIIESTQGLDNALGAYNKAKALYRGDFLNDILFEEWCEQERETLKETFLLILERLSYFFFQQESYHVSLTIYKNMLELDPCQEDIHRQLIHCYQRLNLRDKAIRQYFRCVKALSEELGVHPSEKTRKLFEQLSKGGLVS